MTEKNQIQEKQPIDKKMQDFLGAERWEKGVDSDAKPRSNQSRSHCRELLIRKYKSKFHKTNPSSTRKTGTVRL